MNIVLKHIFEHEKETGKGYKRPQTSIKARAKIPRLTSVEALNQVNSLGHEARLVVNMRGAVLRCYRCMRHTSQHKLGKFLQEGPCKPAAEIMLPEYTNAVGKKPRGEVADHPDAPAATRPRRSEDDAPQSPPPGPAIPAPLPPMIGRQRLHPTHTLFHKQGIFICTTCGCFASSKATNLARPCGPRKKSGVDALARWNRGLTPNARFEWPDPLARHAEGIIWRPRT